MTQERTFSFEQTNYIRIGSDGEVTVPRSERKMWKLCCSVSSGICGVIFLTLGLLVAFLFDPLINSYIEQELIIKNGSTIYESWADPPVVPYLNVYFFNLTNAEGFMSGEKPNFNEVGPYSYREHWKKVNISFHSNGTVTYETLKTYYFNRSRSVGPDSDIIHTLNIPVAVAVDRVKNMGNFIQLSLSSMLTVLNETAFVHKSVKDLVWGYNDPILDIGHRFLPNIPFTEFGFFYQKNDSTDGLLNVFTGENGLENYTMIDTFNHSKKLKYWKTPECNMVNGTDGTSFPPEVNKNHTLYLFNDNLCRSLPLIYNNTIEKYGITGYRFIPPLDVFADISENPQNECYCIDGPPCIGGGVFNISVCKFNTPTIMSFPHFLNAEEYLSNVTGLNPDPLKHTFYVDVNPTIGAPLEAQARLQINFKTTRLDRVTAVRNMPEIIFPVIWFEDGVTSLPDNLVSLLRMSTVLPQEIKLTFLIAFFGLGFILLIGTIVIYEIFDRRSKSGMTINVKSDSVTAITSSRSSSLDSSEQGGHINPTVSPYNPDI